MKITVIIVGFIVCFSVEAVFQGNHSQIISLTMASTFKPERAGLFEARPFNTNSSAKERKLPLGATICPIKSENKNRKVNYIVIYRFGG